METKNVDVMPLALLTEPGFKNQAVVLMVAKQELLLRVSKRHYLQQNASSSDLYCKNETAGKSPLTSPRSRRRFNTALQAVYSFGQTID
jgi:hypothetical protein